MSGMVQAARSPSIDASLNSYGRTKTVMGGINRSDGIQVEVNKVPNKPLFTGTSSHAPLPEINQRVSIDVPDPRIESTSPEPMHASQRNGARIDRGNRAENGCRFT